MDCKQLREILDCYVDGELSPESMASAEAHVYGCPACTRAVEQLNALRSQVRRVVGEQTLPTDLQQRVRRSLRERPTIVMAAQRRWLAAATVVLVAGAGLLAANIRSVNAAVA